MAGWSELMSFILSSFPPQVQEIYISSRKVKRSHSVNRNNNENNKEPYTECSTTWIWTIRHCGNNIPQPIPLSLSLTHTHTPSLSTCYSCTLISCSQAIVKEFAQTQRKRGKNRGGTYFDRNYQKMFPVWEFWSFAQILCITIPLHHKLRLTHWCLPESLNQTEVK